MPFYQGLTRDRVSGALDTALEVDTSFTVTSLFGGAVNLGTGAVTELHYKRDGRLLDGLLIIKVGTSPSLGSGAWYIAGSELPATPATVPQSTAWAGGFGASYTSADSILEMASPVIATIGSPVMVFFCPPGDGGLGNLLSPVIPIPLKAGSFITGRFFYPADSAE